jgi:hypothetical protein
MDDSFFWRQFLLEAVDELFDTIIPKVEPDVHREHAAHD